MKHGTQETIVIMPSIHIFNPINPLDAYNSLYTTPPTMKPSPWKGDEEFAMPPPVSAPTHRTTHGPHCRPEAPLCGCGTRCELMTFGLQTHRATKLLHPGRSHDLLSLQVGVLPARLSGATRRRAAAMPWVCLLHSCRSRRTIHAVHPVDLFNTITRHYVLNRCTIDFRSSMDTMTV